MPQMFRSSVIIFLLSLVSALAVAVTPGTALAQVPQHEYDTTLKKMLNAIQSNSYDQFVARGDEEFKTGFTPKMFEGLSHQLGPKLQKGYSVTFLTTLNQQEYVVYVWKLVFKGVRDDNLITLYTKDGHVSGFLAR